jgi:predicted anti-sigma-YlaC factor YlaD
MFTWHVTTRLARYVDGDLPATDSQAIEAHLATCERCRQELDEIRFASRLVRQLAVVKAPSSVWNGIDAAISDTTGARAPFAIPRWAIACAMLLVVAGGAYWWMPGAQGPWEVSDSGRSTRMAAGELLETGEGSRARIVVGDIGTVNVAPGTRVRLGDAGASAYRLALERGTISAQITAPPRLFIVDTPASTVVDLGCAYTVTVSDEGAGELRMTEGWAALEWKGRESLVPAGAVCRTQPSVGPGTPYFEDAPDPLKRAVDAFDFADGGPAAVEIVLREARVRDTLTLWHLLSRVEPAQRARVYDRIASLVPPPATLFRERVLALDPDALRAWREELAWKW